MIDKLKCKIGIHDYVDIGIYDGFTTTWDYGSAGSETTAHRLVYKRCKRCRKNNHEVVSMGPRGFQINYGIAKHKGIQRALDNWYRLNRIKESTEMLI